MSCVIDLYQWRRASRSLAHPAGVDLPLEDPGHAELLIPQIRNAIAKGRHCSDLIRVLPGAVRDGERVLVLGSGLGVLSTLLARARAVERIIVMEPNAALAAYIDHVHGVNGVPWAETVNAVPVENGRGRVPLFLRHDVRRSSLVAEDGPWRQIALVPGVDLDLILAEERISLIVGESCTSVARMLAPARLASVERLLFGSYHAGEADAAEGELAGFLAARGFEARSFGTALVCDREEAGCGCAEPPRAAVSASP